MKNKVVCFIILVITMILSIFLFENVSYAGYQEMDERRYDVELNEDGSADIVETWNIYVDDTNTLFTAFDTDDSKYGDIKNVKVEEVSKTGNVIKDFRDTGTYAYHVEKGGFYALNTDEDEFEIAWGVSITEGVNKIYRISYTVEDVIKNYNDCSEFYWQFLSSENDIPANKVVGTIKLPRAVSLKENLKVWAHGPLNGEIKILSNDTVSFEVDYLSEGEMLETRIAVTEDIFPLNTNIVHKDKLVDIIQEETEWADEANRKREQQQRIEKTIKLICIILVVAVCIACLVVLIILLVKIIKYIRILANTKKIKPEEKYDYYRDLPENDKTPAEVAFLYYFDKKSAFVNNVSKILSATILDLALKKAISFEEENENLYILVNNEFDLSTLKSDELSIYYLLSDVEKYSKVQKNTENRNRILMKDIEKYAKKNDTRFLSKIEGLEKIAQEYNIEAGNYNKETKKDEKEWYMKGFWYFVASFICLGAMSFIIPLFAVIPCFVCGILCKLIEKRTRTLTQKGVNEQEKWQALKRYMDDFSMLDEREVPELVIWEKYLIYATAFGIADKVIKQLKIRYSEFTNQDEMIDRGFVYLYMMDRINFDRVVTSSMQRAYSTSLAERTARNAASSVGSWSSGGGRRWRLLWWRWPEAGGRRT